MKIYHAVHSICEEQHNIVEEGLDIALLSLVLGALPRLKEVGLDFRATLHLKEWLYPYFNVISMAEKSHEHHIQVISSAIKKTRECGISINSLSLCGFDILDWQGHDRRTLSEAIGDLLGYVHTLRLTESPSALELLSHYALKLHQLDMCDLVIQHTALKHFLKANKKSIRAIGFYSVNTFETNWLENTKLSLSAICSMLNVPQSTPAREVDCGCSLFWEEGQRLLLKDDYVLCSAGTKRKITEI